MASRYNEYTGYIPASNPIDWAKITGGLSTTIQGIGVAREAEKQALDKLMSDNVKILRDADLGKSQGLDHLILSATNNGRDKLVSWNKQLKNGEINPAQYRSNVNNLMSSWSSFANVAKSYDQQMQDALKRQQPDENGKIPGSGFELDNNSDIAQLGDLKNKTIQINPNTGEFMIGQLNSDGIFDPSSVVDVRSLSKPGNIIDNRIYLQDAAAEGTKGWEAWVIEKGATTTSGKLANEKVAKAKIQLAKSIAPNERALTSILVDNTDGEYEFYKNDNEFNSKLQNKIDLQNEVNRSIGKPELSGEALDKFKNEQAEKLIFKSRDDQGVWQPRLTDKQKEFANQNIYDAIDATLDKKITQDEPYRGGSKPKEEKPTSGIPGRVYDAWDNVESMGHEKSEMIMNQASGGKYSFKWEQGGLNVYKPDSRGELVKQNTTPIGSVLYLSDYFGYNPDNWKSEGEKGLQSNTQQKNTKSEIPSATKSDWKKAGWTDAQINQALKEGKIKVI